MSTLPDSSYPFIVSTLAIEMAQEGTVIGSVSEIIDRRTVGLFATFIGNSALTHFDLKVHRCSITRHSSGRLWTHRIDGHRFLAQRSLYNHHQRHELAIFTLTV